MLHIISSEVTDLILLDAQQKQRGSKERHTKLELESLLTKRDGLMAQGVMYKMTENESQTNIKNAETEVKASVINHSHAFFSPIFGHQKC